MNMPSIQRPALPRVVIAGLAGDSGKTLVSLGVVRALVERGRRVAAFKKGPDFIDAAWLEKAARRTARNLDTFLMPKSAIRGSLLREAASADVAVVEGNRGLFDGLDSQGSHSTAELAKLIGAPVILVVDTTKVTRTVAAFVVGCRALDPELTLLGVILNRVGTSRQEALIRAALSRDVGIPVLGAIPRLRDEQLPSRHLGLVTAIEHPEAETTLQRTGEIVAKYVDLDAVENCAKQAGPLARQVNGPAQQPSEEPGRKARIGVLCDKAFSFYYPENLEALQGVGADLLPISPLEQEQIPAIDALYAGGGFPEVYARELSQNRLFLKELAHLIREGLPVWAECGGLMYLSRALVVDDKEYPMVGALPVKVRQTVRPQGHGYVAARVDRMNHFLDRGTRFRGHEFHYSRLQVESDDVNTVFKLEKGVGIGEGRDGIHLNRTLAAYTHVHALGEPSWSRALLRAACGGGA
jgi:cobyrinic acid a,c-diamide synthase